MASATDPFSALAPFFLGSGGGLYLQTLGREDAESAIEGRIRTNPVAPAGPGGSCLFQNLYLTIETWTAGSLEVTPIVNGEVLTDEAMEITIPDPSGVRALHRLEVPLTREYEVSATEVSRAGLVGTWFVCLIELTQDWGAGDNMEVSGVELEYEQLSYADLGLPYTGESMPDPSRLPITTFFLGQAGGGIYRGGQGNQDISSEIEPLLRTNEVAPAGAGGGCGFDHVYFVVTRNNTVAQDVDLTPVVDGVAGLTITHTFAAVSAMVSEMVEVALNQPYLVAAVEESTYQLRGAWFQLLVEMDDSPDSTFEFEGFELEYEILTESLEAVTDA